MHLVKTPCQSYSRIAAVTNIHARDLWKSWGALCHSVVVKVWDSENTCRAWLQMTLGGERSCGPHCIRPQHSPATASFCERRSHQQQHSDQLTSDSIKRL
ncbi:hypothetical protein M758_8G089800 [Ceratodon purpureus]|nr:hypothetical protein M758_8G089800 [Ceratodon purpureus]